MVTKAISNMTTEVVMATHVTAEASLADQVISWQQLKPKLMAFVDRLGDGEAAKGLGSW